MAIQTRSSVSGFIASDPELTFTSTGEARFYARVGQPQSRREPDGSFTQLDPQFSDLVLFRRSAERAHEQFRKGDNFIAEGRIATYPRTVDGVQTQGEQFVASRIGHDNNTTDYQVHRTTNRDAVTQETVSRDPVQAALAEREAQLDPEPPATTATAPAGRDTVAR